MAVLAVPLLPALFYIVINVFELQDSSLIILQGWKVDDCGSESSNILKQDAVIY